ncbi:MAG: phosphoribosyltransferase domain-containing protein, partial [Clostridium sp.]|nr:phosphoribosyltransferase domain-containing protein [Clostridium sp.]
MNCLDFSCDINIKDNPLNLNIEDYLDLALRDNKKRRFLFISKNLGKHIPVNPEKVDNLGYLLAKAYKKKYENYKEERELVIGFAETATALSHSFFNYLESS